MEVHVVYGFLYDFTAHCDLGSQKIILIGVIFMEELENQTFVFLLTLFSPPPPRNRFVNVIKDLVNLN